MAAGILGSVDLVANTTSAVYTNLSALPTTVTLRVCNRGSTNAVIYAALGLSSDADINFARLIEPAVTLSAAGVLEDTGLVVGPGQKLFAKSSVTGVNAIAFGFEGE